MRAGLALFIATIATAGPALAGDKGMGAPPTPRSAETKDVEAWIKRYIKDDGWIFAASSDIGAFLLSPSTIEVTRKGTVTFWYRTELFAPDTLDDKSVRSYTMMEEINCDDRSKRDLALDSYSQNSLGGAVVLRDDDAEAAWEYARPGTVDAILGQQVCEYVDDMRQKTADARGG